MQDRKLTPDMVRRGEGWAGEGQREEFERRHGPIPVAPSDLKFLTEAQVLDRVRDLVCYGRTQADLARECGIAPSKVSEALSGKRSIPSKLLSLAGIERRYVEKHTHSGER